MEIQVSLRRKKDPLIFKMSHLTNGKFDKLSTSKLHNNPPKHKSNCLHPSILENLKIHHPLPSFTFVKKMGMKLNYFQRLAPEVHHKIYLVYTGEGYTRNSMIGIDSMDVIPCFSMWVDVVP